MSFKAKIAATAGTAALVAAGVMGATAAGASTDACSGASGRLAGSCGTEVNVYGNGWDVKGQHASYNAAIIAYPDVDADNGQVITSDPATDFYAHQTTGNSNERVFEYAPNGRRSGLCISDPASGYAGNPGGRDGLVLRTCNGSTFQEFVGLGDTQNDQANHHHGIQWQDVATDQVVATNGTGAPLNTVDGTGVAGSYFHWVQ